MDKIVKTVDGAELLIPLCEVVPAGADSPQLPASLFRIPIDVIEHVISTRTTTGNIVDSLPVRHHFSDGCYARELTLPAGILATARRHRTYHLCILSAGEITVWEEGCEPVVYEAPCTFVGRPGTRRIGYAHSTTIWTTIFPNQDDETDPAALLDRYTEVVPPHMTPSEIETYLDVLRSLDSGEDVSDLDLDCRTSDGTFGWAETAQLLLAESSTRDIQLDNSTVDSGADIHEERT